jgi:hypothetical protein
MKRAGGLWEQVLHERNLHEAFARAAAGKRDRIEVRRFSANLDENLRQMSRDLAAGVFAFGHYRRFTIYEPKERVIHAAAFVERVAHHALIGICGPVLDRCLTTHTFACRVGRGRTAALAAASRHAAQEPYFLKMDVRKYFDSLPHAGVQTLLARLFKEAPLLACFDRILSSHETTPGRGLPIGSLVSQHLANAYLGSVDRLVTESLRLRCHVRYMDDMVTWSAEKHRLREAESAIGAALDSLGLAFKAPPFLNRCVHGMDFLGCRIFPGRREPNRATRVRWLRSLRSLEAALTEGALSEAAAQRRLTALSAHMALCGGAGFARRVLREKLWSDAIGLESGQPRRLVEQQREQLPRLEPQQEQPVQQEQQHRVPPGPSTPWGARYAQSEAVPVSDPSREETPGQTAMARPVLVAADGDSPRTLRAGPVEFLIFLLGDFF